ncbi:14 kDa phosphohistidine phosphatase-like [Babylonia areolata]|uniref:14 kDa phosphohistidine phosphatase-like n=1 Tax=Babylonia areolata TaxID=304850 RepID=UPI003FD1676E
MAAKKIASDSAKNNSKLGGVSNAEIDASGRFKYILIKVYDKDVDEDYKYIVRGTVKAPYHADIYDMVVDGIESRGLDCEVLGGGRIEHNPSAKQIQIYGYSVGYGKADHAITQAVLENHFPGYTITWSDEGY